MSLVRARILRTTVHHGFRKPAGDGRRHKSNETEPVNPRAAGIGHAIETDFAAIRENYGKIPLRLSAYAKDI